MNLTLASDKESRTDRGSEQILCCYSNSTSRIQTIQIANIADLHFERVIFPGQRVMFEAVPEANLEIKTSENDTSLVSCDRLRVTEVISLQKK